MSSPVPAIGSSWFMPLYAGALGMSKSERALASDAASIAVAGPSVQSMLDVAIQPALFAFGARIVDASSEMTGSALDVLA